MAYMTKRQTEKREQKSVEERRRALGERVEKEQAAKAAGFGTIEEYELHLRKSGEEQQRLKLESRFEQVKKSLIENGTPIRVQPGEGCCLLIVLDGQLYSLSDSDEYSLLACAASALV